MESNLSILRFRDLFGMVSENVTQTQRLLARDPPTVGDHVWSRRLNHLVDLVSSKMGAGQVLFYAFTICHYLTWW